MIQLIRNPFNGYHVSLDTVYEFENAILANTNEASVKVISSDRNILKAASKFFNFLKKRNTHTFVIPVIQKIIKSKSKIFFVVLMGCDFNKSLPYFFCGGKKCIYLFDAWADTHKQLIEYINVMRISHSFISSRDATHMLSVYKSKCNFHWVPEGINPKEYRYYPYDQKEIDVLQLGRKYDNYHNQIVGFLQKKGKIYLYEKEKGKIIFPTRDAFIEGMARAKISISVPSNITHPERAGSIETMTIRYLQSMSSKCLIVGKAPQEMISLFGYNPVIELDMKQPSEQLEAILNNFSQYIPLIEKNYKHVLNHTWSNRWQDILKILHC